MKSLKPFICFAGISAVTLVQANAGFEAYQMGHYDKAANLLQAGNGSDKIADYYLGRMQLYGYGMLKNNENALRSIESSAKSGFSQAMRFMARYELIVKKNPESAYGWFAKLAAKGDQSAQMYVIAARRYGYGIHKEQSRAQNYYIQEAKEGNAKAQYVLGMQFLNARHYRNQKLGRIWLGKAAEQQYPRAQTQLADYYLKGQHGFQKSQEKAVELYISAAENHYVSAMIKLAEMAIEQSDYKVARAWLDKGVAAENSKAMLAMAQLYLSKKSPWYDPKEGFAWTEKAAQKQSLIAMKALSKLYKEGTGVEASPEKARQWDEKAVAAEKSTARLERQVVAFLSTDKAKSFTDTDYQLNGILTNWQNPEALLQARYNAYPKMRGVQSDEIFKPKFELATPQQVAFNEYFNLLAPMLSFNDKREWRFPRYPLDIHIQKLMDNESLVLTHSDWQSMVNQGRPYPKALEEGPFNYLEQNTSGWRQRANLYTVVMRLYNQAILGNPDAQFQIGQLYHYGVGLAKDPEQARLYYELAAAQDDVRAEYNLGILYMERQLPSDNYEKGMAWLNDAAFRGNAYAQYALANIYQHGFADASGMLVVPQDEQQALSMYYLSSANNFALSQYKLANFLVSQYDKKLSVSARNARIALIKKLYAGAVDQGLADAYLPFAFYQAMSKDNEARQQAFTIAEREAETGNPQAALLLGLMYDRGIAVNPDPVKALYWFQQADDSPVKSFILGTYYSNGQGINKDLNKGERLLQDAAQAGFSYANFNLAVLKQQRGESFLFDLIKAKDEGNTKAALLMADYYLALNADEQNLMQARDIYHQLAEKGESEAQLKLGYLYLQGKGGTVNHQQAGYWFEKAATQGQPMAQFLLAQMHQMGQLGSEPDYKAAIQWYAKAQQVMPRAALALGFVYDTAEDQYGQAMSAYQLAANQQLPLAQYNLGLLYENGKGMPVNMSKARELYTQAAEQQQPQAMSRLANFYFYGHGGDKNDNAAFEWFKKAADGGDRIAMYQLGLMAESGIGRSIDFSTALKYYQKSSDLGDVKASLALARIYQYGLGGFNEPRKAESIYQTLANRGNGFAQYQLALIHMKSAVDKESIQVVKKLLEQAQANGNIQAEVLLQKMDAFNNAKRSFVEPVAVNTVTVSKEKSADQLYREALNEWNQGDAILSKMMLQRLIKEYPLYTPAQRAYEQLNQPITALKLG